MLKKIIRKLVGKKGVAFLSNSSLRKLIELIANFYIDGKLFYKNSMVFKDDTFNKIESRIILHYHGIEKGFIYKKFKYRFGENRVKELNKLLHLEEVVKHSNHTQIAAAYLAMCKYYEKHQINGVDISDYYTISDYEFYKKLSSLDLDLTKTHTRLTFFNASANDFETFSRSRASIRSFTGEKISLDTINNVINLAKTAPSVCNRQPVKVYYTENKERIDRIFALQQGLKGYSDEISQLLVVVSDRSYFAWVGERNQMYIDGGIFVMNLLYALHFNKIGACPAHWAFNYDNDRKIQIELNLNESEKVICLIPIGVPKEQFSTTLSLRRGNDEILKII